MREKQDRVYARTASDLERKYKFGQTFAEVMGYASDARETAEQADDAVEKLDKELDQEEILKRLTNNYESQGIYRENGLIYVNASCIKSGTIDSKRINGATLNIKSGATIAGWNIDVNSIFKTTTTWDKGTFVCTGSNYSYSIGGSEKIPGWVFGAGGKFGVTKDGALYADDVHLTGTIHAKAGEIGAWELDNYGYLIGTAVIGTEVEQITISPAGVDGFYTDSNGIKRPASVSWNQILTATMRWNE